MVPPEGDVVKQWAAVAAYVLVVGGLVAWLLVYADPHA